MHVVTLILRVKYLHAIKPTPITNTTRILMSVAANVNLARVLACVYTLLSIIYDIYIIYAQ